MQISRHISVILFIVLNCVGSGALALPTSLAPFGISAFYGWIITGLGAFALGMVLVRLAELNPESRLSLHSLIAAPLGNSRYLRRGIFLSYLFFAIMSNAALGILISFSLQYFFPVFAQSILCYILIFFVFFMINISKVEHSKALNNFLAMLKLVILIGLPLIAYFVLPFDVSIPITISSYSVSQCMFKTLWAFVGIETVMCDDRSTDIKDIKSGIMWGILICTGIYIFNTYVLMRNVTGLQAAMVGDLNLFRMIFPGKEYLFNISVLMICCGSLHGWTYTVSEFFKSGKSMLPFKFRTNLVIASVIPVFTIWLLKFYLKKDNALFMIFEISTLILLIIFAIALLGFGRQIITKRFEDNICVFDSKSQQRLDFGYLIIAVIYVSISIIASIQAIWEMLV